MEKGGFFGKIKKIFLRSKSCDCRASCGENKEKGETKDKKYRCQICDRMIHEEHSLEHIKAEEYIINLIKNDHSHWQHGKPTCQECIEYYRKLIKKTEI